MVCCDVNKLDTNDSNADRVTFFLCDISKAKEVEELMEKIKTKFGRLDVLIANAGIVGSRATKLGIFYQVSVTFKYIYLANSSVKNFEDVCNTNINGTWFTLK